MENSKTLIDTEFDFRQEVGDKDPDIHSPTLKQYHQILWNKPLPNGQLLQISSVKSKYLVGTCEDKSIEEERKIVGFHDIYGSLFDEIGFKNIFNGFVRNKSAVNILYHFQS